MASQHPEGTETGTETKRMQGEEAVRIKRLLLSASNPDDRPTYQKDAVDSEFAGGDGTAVKFRKAAVDRWLSDASITSTWSLQARHQDPHSTAHENTAPPKPQSSLFSRFSDAPHRSSPAALQPAGSTSATTSTVNKDAGSDTVEAMGTCVQRDEDTVGSWQALALEVMREEEAAALGNSQELGLSFAADTDVEAEGNALAGMTADAARRNAQADSPLAEIVMLPGGRFFVQYEMLNKLGEGAFGEAFKARRRKDGKLFCVKMYHADMMSEKDKQDVKNEAAILATLNHPNIVQYQETYTDNRDGRLILVMELAEEGDLQQALHDREGHLLPESDVMLCFVQLAMGVLHIHDRGIIHRDLKCCNSFIAAGGLLKLGDFGIAKAVAGSQPSTGTVVGTPSFMSPELIQGHKYDAKTDIWALGCILYELCTLRKAFEAVNMASIMIKILSGKVPPLPPVFSRELQSLLTSMLQRQPDVRPGIREVLQTEIVKQHLARYEQLVRQGQSTRRVSIIAALRSAGAPAPEQEDDPSLLSALSSAESPEQQPNARSIKPAEEVEEQVDSKVTAEARLQEQTDARAKLRAYKAQLRSRVGSRSDATGAGLNPDSGPGAGAFHLTSPQAKKSMTTLLQDMQSLQIAKQEVDSAS